jgi:outer membrane protein TolC
MLGGALLVVTGALRAAPTEEQIDLRDALWMAEQRPSVAAARHDAESAHDQAEASGRAVYWPHLTLNGFAEHTSDLATLATPLGELPLGDYSQREIGMELRQPLLQPSAAATARADREEAAAQEATLGRTIEVNAFNAASRYLDILATQSQLGAENDLQASLMNRLGRLTAEENVGRVLHADVLRVRLAVDESQQRIILLEQRLAVARRAFAHALGQDTAPQPARVDDLARNVAIVAAENTNEEAVALRPDVAALAAQARSLDSHADAARNTMRPNLYAMSRYTASSGLANLPPHEFRVGVGLSWPLFSGGVAGKQADAYTAKADSLRDSLMELKRSVALEVHQADADFITATSVRDLAVSAIASAQETLNTRNARYDQGRQTIDDVLDAEADLSKQKALLDVASVSIVRAWLAFQLATGQNLLAVLDRQLRANAGR